MRTDTNPKPDPKRQAVYVAVTLAALFGGYFIGTQFKDDKAAGLSDQPAADNNAKPWYRSQTPPPLMVTAADKPLFPDFMDKIPGMVRRAYEEALPQEVYVPAVVSMLIPPRGPAIKPPNAVKKLLAWRRFAVNVPQTVGKSRIALVIDDMGVDKKRSAKIISLKAPLTLSFMTYANNLAAQTRAARAAGHELLLHVTMEPTSKNVDPGPNVLLTSHDAKELLRRLRWGMARFTSYIGINNHMGSKFTADSRAMTVVLLELKKRGLMFLDSRTSGATVGGKLARSLKVPYAERNIFLDNVNDEAAVYARLAEVEALARRNGYAIAIGHPRDATIKILPKWIDEIKKLGFVLVPLSSVTNDVN